MPVVPPLLLPPFRVLVDSAAYQALLDRNEQHHLDAVTILDSLSSNHYRQFTTNAILFEAHTLVLSRLGIAHATRFLKDMRESNPCGKKVDRPVRGIPLPAVGVQRPERR